MKVALSDATYWYSSVWRTWSHILERKTDKTMIEMKQPFDIDQYLIEIGREELLTLEQKQELAELIRQGDNSAATSLARANLRFVVALVRQLQARV